MTRNKSPLGYIVLDDADGIDVNAVEVLARDLNFSLLPAADIDSYSDALKLIFIDGQWQVHFETGGAVVSVDFADAKLSARANHADLHREYVVRAVIGRKKIIEPLTVLDATAGFGQDAFLLAAAGCQVTMIEQIPLLAYLLDQAVQRSKSLPDTVSMAAERMFVRQADSVALMRQWSGDRPEVVYLDPMYAHSDSESKRGLKKTAAVKKNMAFLRRLTAQSLGMNIYGEGMIEAALALASSKVIVKRAPGAEWLSGVKPASSLEGKAARFDIYPL